jgi:hypothetical protein
MLHVREPTPESSPAQAGTPETERDHHYRERENSSMVTETNRHRQGGPTEPPAQGCTMHAKRECQPATPLQQRHLVMQRISAAMGTQERIHKNVLQEVVRQWEATECLHSDIGNVKRTTNKQMHNNGTGQMLRIPGA